MRATRPRTPRPNGTYTVDQHGIVEDYKPPERSPSEREKLENLLAHRIELAGLPTPLRQHYWAKPERMYRSDFAYVGAHFEGGPVHRILIEVQGGIWANDPGRHNRGSGYQADCERSCLAVVLGWRILAFTEAMIRKGSAVEFIKRALNPPPIVTPEQLPLDKLSPSPDAALTARGTTPKGLSLWT